MELERIIVGDAAQIASDKVYNNDELLRKSKSDKVVFAFVTGGRKPINISSDGKNIEIIDPRVFLYDGSFAQNDTFSFVLTGFKHYYIKATFVNPGAGGLSLELIQGYFWEDEKNFNSLTFVFAYRDSGGGWFSRYASVQMYLTVNQIPYYLNNFLLSGNDLTVSLTDTKEVFKIPSGLRMLYSYGFYENSGDIIIDTDKNVRSQYIKAVRGVAGTSNSLTFQLVSGYIPTLGNSDNLKENEYILCYKVDGGKWQSFYAPIQDCLTRYYVYAKPNKPKFFFSDTSEILIAKTGSITFPARLRLMYNDTWAEISNTKTVSPIFSLSSCYITAKVKAWEAVDGLELKANAGRIPQLGNTFLLDENEFVLCYLIDGGVWQSDFAPIQASFTKVELFEGLIETATYGKSNNQYADGFNPTPPSGICYNKGSEAQTDGTVKTLSFKAVTTGTATFVVGLVDQWGKCIEESSFTVEVSAIGLQDHAVNIPIKKGQIVFAILDIQDDDKKIIGYNGSAGEASLNTLMYNDIDRYGVMWAFDGANGGFAQFSYTVHSRTKNINQLYEKVETQNSDISLLNSRIETVANNTIIPDVVNGNKYRLIASNGNLVLKPLQYKKVMAFGNSITRHGIAPFWWGDWGMAATTRENDWVHKLQSILRTKIADAVVSAYNIAEWELNHGTYDYSILDQYLTPDTEAVILRVGENVGDTTNYDADFETLINYIYSKIPLVDIYIGGQFWEHIEKENMMKAVATKKNIPFVDFSYMWGNPIYESSLDTQVFGDDGVWHTISDGGAIAPGVARHPGNLGMEGFANGFGNTMGY